ncbi:MAG: hypothetical protein OEV43_06945 [Coriobacteriia bacterium]|nr:hypothetical protein [Coriobacteriia bacterium]
MKNRLSAWTAIAVSYLTVWLVWNLLTIPLTVEMAQIQDKWQPWLTILRVLFPFMYFGGTFMPEWFAIAVVLLFPVAYLVACMWLAKDWSFKKGLAAGSVWAAAVGLSAALSPPDQQAGRLYHLARGEIGEAVKYFLTMGALTFILVAVALNLAVLWGARFVPTLRARFAKPENA